MPRSRLEIFEFLVVYAIEIAEQFDDLVVRIAVIDSNIMARTMPHRPPKDVLALAPQHVTCLSQMRMVFQFERDVLHGVRLSA